MPDKSEKEGAKQVSENGRTTERRIREITPNTESNWLVSETVDSFVPPALAVLSVFMTWATASVMTFSRSWSGLDLQTGQLVLGVALVVLGMTFYFPQRIAGWARYIGGVLILSVCLLQMVMNRWARDTVVQQAQESGNSITANMASTATVNADLGLWLAVIAGLLMIIVEYRRRRS